jgi:DNA-directed RNA polymerase subunit RPC12/RpoP
VSGRITTYLDPGLGWTRPVVVARCAVCGTELAGHPNQVKAERAARRTRCLTCGTRTARRLPGTTSPATDLALARGWQAPAGRRRWSPVQQPTPRLAGRRRTHAWYLAARC